MAQAPIFRDLKNATNIYPNHRPSRRIADAQAKKAAEIRAAEQDCGYWVSYNPVAHNVRARLHIVRIDRNQAGIDRMAQRVSMATEYRDQIIDRIRSL